MALADLPMDVPPRRLSKISLAAAVGALVRRDTDLAAIVRRHGLPPLWARPQGFATLVHIILEQQVSLASAKAALERLRGGLGELTPERVADASFQELRDLGLTRQKAGYCIGLATLIVERGLDLNRLSLEDDQTARRVLLGVRGIGPWTADIYLLMALRRPDVWPDGDLALVSVLREVKGLRARPAVAEARALVDHWTPWRSVGARILWHHYLCAIERR